MRRAFRLLAMIALLGGTMRAHATDQPLEAARLLFAENATGSEGKATWFAKSPAPALPAQDPRAVGATLRIIGLDQDVVFVLARERWALDAGGTRYGFKEAKAVGRPSRVKALIAQGKGVKVSVRDPRVDLDDTTPAVVSVLLTVGTDVYCSTCTTATVSGGGRYAAAACPAAATCPAVSPLACGTFLTKWGEFGSGGGEFDYFYAIATDPEGHIYVADRGNSRIQKFDSGGRLLAKWDRFGSGDGQFRLPVEVTADASGDVYVADVFTNRIQKLTGDGAFLMSWGGPGSGPGELDTPYGVAVSSTGDVYVADTNNHRIQKFDASGSFLTAWGSYGDADGEFDYPYDVAVDGGGNVYVADAENYRIQKFDADGSFLTKWGSEGSWFGQFDYPVRLTTDSSGNVYVVDYGDRVQKFDGNGTFIDAWGGTGTADGQLQLPLGVATGGDGWVYVGDRGNERIQLFACP